MKHLNTCTNISSSIFSTYFVLKCAIKIFGNRFTNKNSILKKYFYIDKGDNSKSFTLNSCKIVDFLQTFGPLASFCTI